MLDYKTILKMRYVLGFTGARIARELDCSKNGVNDFLAAFERCGTLGYPLPQGITNEGIYVAVYGSKPRAKGERDASYVYPDYEKVNGEMKRVNMTLFYQWGKYKDACAASGGKPYSYRQFCALYSNWCGANDRSAHFEHVPGREMEVDFAGKTFKIVDPIDGAVGDIVVFVAVLPCSQYTYAEGMVSTREPQWIEANNNALEFFGGAPQVVVCDNCKQAVLVNKDWIAPELNPDYADWAEHNGAVVMAAKVRKPRYKPSVEGGVGALEKGLFHDLEDVVWRSLDDFNGALWRLLAQFNRKQLSNRERSREYYYEDEKKWLLTLPEAKYQYAERREATVSSDYHIRFDNAYYSCPHRHAHEKVLVRATADEVSICDLSGARICSHARAKRKGEWVTDPTHLPQEYHSYRDWSPEFFMRKAALVGQYTESVIGSILSSRKYQAQTFRCCCGVLALANRHGGAALEAACKEAVGLRKPNYTTVKNLVKSQADSRKRDAVAGRNANAYLASEGSSDIGAMIARTAEMVAKEGGGDDD